MDAKENTSGRSEYLKKPTNAQPKPFARSRAAFRYVRLRHAREKTSGAKCSIGLDSSCSGRKNGWQS